jgi:hypothetical protein
MQKRWFSILVGISIFLSLSLVFSTNSFARRKLLIFGGGPAGGTFQVVANAVQTYKPVKKMKDYNIKAQSSGGSVENLRRVDSGRSHFGVVYSGHVYAGRKGLMVNDPTKYDNVMAVSFLYGAPAQLVVKAKSGIKSALDLKGKKVGVGNAGSGAYSFCEQFFTHIGIWDQIERNAMGYNDAAAAFGNNQLDAFWLFTAFPSGAVIQAAQMNDIAMIDLAADAENTGFFKKYPNFTRAVIPAGTYKGVDTDTGSFFDGTLWVAHKDTPEDAVYQLLSLIYSDEGLKWMVSQKKTFRSMNIQDGVKGIATPLHPGAEKFWKEKGIIQ